MAGKRDSGGPLRRLRSLLSGLGVCCVGAGLLTLMSCGGSSNSSGPLVPLPNGQIGSLNYANGSLANCFVSDLAACSSTNYLGANPISALAAATISSANYLYWGDSAGNIDSASIPTNLTTYPSPVVCANTTATSGYKIRSLAVVPAASGPLLYATAQGVYSLPLLSSSGQCTNSSTAGTLISGTSNIPMSLAYNGSTNLVIGVTSSFQSYSCTTSSPICISHGKLTGLQDTSPQITAIASDPNYAIVYLLAIGTNNNRIYAYQVNSNGSLSYLTNYTGPELSSPQGLTLFQGNTGTQNYCTTGPCTFLDVTNTTNTTITQYVLTYSYSGTTPNGVSINQFNLAYYNCDLIAPKAIAAIPLMDPTTKLLNTPNVFVGEAGTQAGPCLGILSTGTYGNNVTAYTVNSE